MKISRKVTNKIIGKIDRYFTWTDRYIEVGKVAKFYYFDDDNNVTEFVTVRRTALGLWCFYRLARGEEVIQIGKYCKNFAEIYDFVEQVKLIG